MFKPVSSRVSFPEMEKQVLEFWKKHDTFKKSVARREGGPRYTLFEGPPTANGSPGIHHVLSRVFKDIMPRYKTMKGYYAPRKGGWDTHGLPVELEVERELGLHSKHEIETYGIAAFNQKCRDSVFRYVQDWERLTDRIAFWVDQENAYVTYHNPYIETGWWILKQLWDKGLLYEGRKVAPHCPRCVTTLSDHEVALGYEENTPDPSVYIKFEVDLPTTLTHAATLPSEERATLESTAKALQAVAPTVYLLAWTTTPWTLPGNTALAVAPASEYSLVRLESGDLLIMASALLSKAIKGKYEVVQTFQGEQLVGVKYKPLYNPFDATLPQGSMHLFESGHLEVGAHHNHAPERMAKHSFQVHPAEFVSMDDGTGIVHIAPAFGQDDYLLGSKQGLLFVQHVDPQGVIQGNYAFAGKFIKDADKDIRRDLRERGLLYRDEVLKHTYPFCWRCKTPLLYYAKVSWYIKTTAVKEALVAKNKQINWYPDHIREGRFGEWLRNNIDWAISRERYWGTPIPIWRCEKGHMECVGGVDDLKSRPGATGFDGDLDLHRPYVDDVTFNCPKCSSAMRRIPEVMDCWFDSGAMPFAQSHYPFENKAEIEGGTLYPADFICEAVDQTRGWFYSLHAIATLLESTSEGKVKAPSYKNVICLGLILDNKGEKMSKSKGNVVNPWSVLDAHGTDATRWYLYTAAPPGNARRFSADLVSEVVRTFLLTLWNTYSFFVTYANIDSFDPATAKGVKPTAELDRWVLAELNRLVDDVTKLLESYDPTGAGRRIQQFVDDLSNWYVRRSRRRFWKSENDSDKLSAYATLYQCLVTLSRLLAPFTPFVAEEMYQNLVRSFDKSAPESVHMADYPVVDPALADDELVRATQLVMKVVSLGRAARSKAKIKVRQPLGRVLVSVPAPKDREVLQQLAPQVLEELNVKEFALAKDDTELVEVQLKPNFATIGPKFGKDRGKVVAAIQAAPAKEIARKVKSGLSIELAGFALQPEDILVTTTDRPGLAAASEADCTVAVDTTLSPGLVKEGIARELVHRIQNMRKTAGLEIADRIVTYYSGQNAIAEVFQEHAAYIKQETLSERLVSGPPEPGAHVETSPLDGQDLTLAVKKVGA